jgi:hypothetical protein
MSAYNPITVRDLERLAVLGGWKAITQMTPLEGQIVVALERPEECAGFVEILVHCTAGQRAGEVEVHRWTCTELDGYDSRDDEADHRAPQAWQPTIALGSLISRLLQPSRPVR